MNDYNRIVNGIIHLIIGFGIFLITFPCVNLVASFFGLIVFFFILFALIGITLIGIGLCYILEKEKYISDKFQRFIQIQEELSTKKHHYKNKEKKKKFTEAFPYYCNNCKMFSYTFLEYCELCGAKNTTRKAIKGDYKTYLKIKL